jgi:hypothetical protein
MTSEGVSTSTFSIARFLVRSEATFGRRLLLLFAGAIVGFAWHGPVPLWSVDCFFALLLALSILTGRDERRAAVAFLETLPVSENQARAAAVGLDLLAPAAVTVASLAAGRGGGWEGPLAFSLAVLWGVGWSRARPERWTALWCVVSFVPTIAVLHRGGVLAMALALVAMMVWLLIEAFKGERRDHALTHAPSIDVPSASSVPLLRSAPLTLGSSSDAVLVLWSAFMVYIAIRSSPQVFGAIAPLAMALVAANSVAARTGGPAREFFLTRPIGRLRYHLAPIAFGLAVTLAPTMAELGTAHFRSERTLANDIYYAMCSPGTQGERPRSDDLAAWKNFYARGLRREMSLAALPDDSLERNSDPREWPYVPTATLRSAVRSAWQARQLRIALLTVIIFLACLWFMVRGFGPSAGRGGRIGRATHWSVRSLCQIAVLPLILAAKYPGWLLVPVWVLFPALFLAAVGLGRSLLALEVG